MSLIAISSAFNALTFALLLFGAFKDIRDGGPSRWAVGRAVAYAAFLVVTLVNLGLSL